MELMGRKRIGSCWMGKEYVQEHRCLQRTDNINKKNPDGPVANELDLSEGETLVYLMKHDDNDHCMVAGREWKGAGQVGYVPAAYLMIIIDETLQEEGSY